MVDYRGPEVFRGLAQRFNVHMFDRIRKIEFKFNDPAKIQLAPAEMARLPQLETISIVNRRPTILLDANTFEKFVPECRVASIDQNENQNENQIEINLNPPSVFGCSTK